MTPSNSNLISSAPLTLPGDAFEAAQWWSRRGYNVVPQKATGLKHPAVKWRELQSRRVIEAELMRWQPLFGNGVGFITGEISGIVVIETDGPRGEALLAEFERRHGALPETLEVRSGSGRGLHRHFKHPGHKVKTKANTNIKIDVKGDGGYCVLPPSRHKSGGHYQLVRDAEPADLPLGLLEFIASAADTGAQGELKVLKPKGAGVGVDSSFLDDPPDYLQHFDLEAKPSAVQPDKAPPPVETMRAALLYLASRDAFKQRDNVLKDVDGRIISVGWRECGMALKTAYPEAGFDLWAITHVDERARSDAPSQWNSFASDQQPGHVTVSTIIHAAKNAGFTFARPTTTSVEPGYVSHRTFTMDGSVGLTKEVAVGRGRNSQIETVWISAPFEVLGACRDPGGRAWGKQLRFRDADQRIHMRHVSDAALQGDPASLCAALADEGLAIDRVRQREFAQYLNGVLVAGRVTVVSRTGWHEIGKQPVFVLPAETIATVMGETVVLDPLANGPYEARASLQDWKLGVGQLTAGHALPVFAVSAALAGPLAHLVNAEGGGVHVFGPSSIGKSAMLQAAASVWGRGATPGYVRSWRATSNGLEGAAASATDTCLILDELGVGEARDVAASVYTLGNGVGKSRAARDGSAREPKSWRVSVISSGELPVETKLSEDRGRKTRAGQLVRLLDIPANRRLGFGAFDHAGASGDAGQLADAIKEAAIAAYGTAGPEFVRQLLLLGVEKIRTRAEQFMQAFVRSAIEQTASEQVKRAAKRFALIALAGELATHCGITPWKTGEAYRAAKWTLSRWLERRGGVGSHEERQAIEQVRLIIEQHGDSRFERTDGGLSQVRDRLGWQKGAGPKREWWIPSETWKAEVCNGLDPTFVARALAARGMLRRQDQKHMQCVVALGDNQRIRAYVLTAAVLGSSEGE